MNFHSCISLRGCNFHRPVATLQAAWPAAVLSREFVRDLGLPGSVLARAFLYYHFKKYMVLLFIRCFRAKFLRNLGNISLNSFTNCVCNITLIRISEIVSKS